MNNPFAIARKYLSDDNEHKPADVPSGGTEPSDMECILNENVIAVLIDSTIGALLWLAFDDSFDPRDEIPVFYCDELEFLKHVPAETLRKIYETKSAFGPRTRVRQ